MLVSHLFFYQPPTGRPLQTMVTSGGKVWGFVLGSNPYGDQIDYNLAQAPTSGTVSVSPDGVYTYTPGSDFNGTDAFTVTLSSPGFHINLLNLFGKQTRDVSVQVTGSPADPAGKVVATFDGTAGSPPDPALFGTDVGALLDAGLQTYTNSPDNVRLDGQGHLVIKALNTATGYTSAMVTTQGKLNMQYGTMVARIKMPSGQGIWPAFWELGSQYSQATWNAPGPTGWPGCGEIDVMELINQGTTYYATLHGPQTTFQGGSAVTTDYYGGGGQVVGTSGPIDDLTTGFHDYWVMREPDIIVIGVDDTMLATFTPASLPQGGAWVFNNPMFARLNIAVGGSWPGPPDATTPWPATMLVDSFSYTPSA